MSDSQEYIVYNYAFGDQVYQFKQQKPQSNITLRTIGTTLNPTNVVHIIPAARNANQSHSPTIRIVEDIQVQQPTEPPVEIVLMNEEPILVPTTGDSNSSVPVLICEDEFAIIKEAGRIENAVVEEVELTIDGSVEQTKEQKKPKARKKTPKLPRPKEKVSEPKPVTSKKISAKSKKNFIYECDICDSRFLSAMSLKLHKTGHRYAPGDEKKAFKCRYCGRQFSHLQTLGDHEKVHIDDRYNCAACGAKYSSKSGLRNHLTKHVECNISYQDRKVQRKKEEEDGKRHGCDVCGKKYRHRKSMVEHRSLHFKNKQHRCERCGAMFETTGGWRKHTANKRCELSKKLFKDAGDGGDAEEVFIPEERKRFLEQVERLKESEVIKSRKRKVSDSESDVSMDAFNHSENSDEDDKPLIEMVTVSDANKDELCGSVEEEEPILDAIAVEPLEVKEEIPSDEEPNESSEDHEHDRNNDENEDVSKEIDSNSESSLKDDDRPLKEIVKSDSKPQSKSKKPKNDKVHQCPKCQKTFTRSFILKNHLRTHTGERPFLCDTCPKSFGDATSLKLHTIVHTGEKPFACPECPSRFARKSGLRNHVTVHYNLPCDECDQKFPSRKTLMRHKVKHQGIRPFLCEICSKDFRTKADMKAHLRIHSNEKRYCCKICSARFNCPSTLRRHRNVHAPPETRPMCGTCGKSFSSAQALRKHENIHKDLRPFRCELCGKCFRVKDHLKIHQRSHSGDKPFACDMCEKRFVSNGDLKVHYRRHTGEKPFVCDECGVGFVVMAGLYRHQQQTGHQSNKPQAIIVQEYTRAT